MTWHWRQTDDKLLRLDRTCFVWNWIRQYATCKMRMEEMGTCPPLWEEDAGNGGLSPVASDDMTVSATSSVTVTLSPVTDHHCYSICCLRTQGRLTSSRCGHCVRWTVSKWSKSLVSAILINVSLIRPLEGGWCLVMCLLLHFLRPSRFSVESLKYLPWILLGG